MRQLTMHSPVVRFISIAFCQPTLRIHHTLSSNHPQTGKYHVDPFSDSRIDWIQFWSATAIDISRRLAEFPYQHGSRRIIEIATAKNPFGTLRLLSIIGNLWSRLSACTTIPRRFVYRPFVLLGAWLSNAIRICRKNNHGGNIFSWWFFYAGTSASHTHVSYRSARE